MNGRENDVIYVVGDRHALSLQAADLTANPSLEIRQVRATATAAEIVAELPQGFQGSLLLSFGITDKLREIFQGAQASGMQAAVAAAVSYYTYVIFAVKKLHANLAVWGLLPEPVPQHNCVGNVWEHNLAILLFTEMLSQRLKPLGVPFISMAHEMLALDGTASPEYYTDDERLSPRAQATALQLIRSSLSIGKKSPETNFAFSERFITEYESVEFITENHRRYLRITLPGEPLFITNLFIRRPALARWYFALVGCSLGVDDHVVIDGNENTAQPVDEYFSRLPINAFAKVLNIRVGFGCGQEDEFRIFARTSPLGSPEHRSKAALLAFRDHLMGERTVPVITGESTLPLPAAVPKR